MGKTRVRALAGAAIVVMAASLVGVMSPAGATAIGEEGCTPGYWKNHTANWEEYTPGITLGSQFVFPAQLSGFGSQTMLQALAGGGGPGVSGAATILMRAAVAAYLNAAHEGLGYPYRRFVDPFNIHAQVNAALASLDRDAMLQLATTLDTANNLGCPLS
jgi:hypothetical protein